MVHKKRPNLPKLPVILGPTGSGKSSLALTLAKKFNGEIVVADSRQVYKHFSIGTNKDKGVWETVHGVKRYIVSGVVHHCIDFVDPKHTYTLYEYQFDAKLAIQDILSRGKQPILSGGTGMYIRAITDNWIITKAKASKSLRSVLSKKSTIELINEIKAIDPNKVNELDIYNKRRLMRVLEVYYQTGEMLQKRPKKGKQDFLIFKIGINIPRAELYEKIDSRVDRMMDEGLLNEVKKLSKKYKHTTVFSSIGYRELQDHLNGTVTLGEAIEQMKRSTRRYARKQLTWWRKEADIHWIDTTKKAERTLTSFFQ